MDLMMNQLQTCTHTPKINTSKGNEKNIMKRTEEILMKKNEKIRQKREQIAREKEDLECTDCTFQPNINRTQNKTYLKSKRDVSDLMAWQKSKDDKLFESLLEKSKIEQETTTFAPKISDNSKKIAEIKCGQQCRIEDRLYEVPKSRPVTPKPCASSTSSRNEGTRKYNSKSPINYSRGNFKAARKPSVKNLQSKRSFDANESQATYDSIT